MTIERYRKYLTEHAVQYVEHQHIAIRTVADVEAIAPHFLESMVKCVAFRVKDGALVLVAARGMQRIDYKRVATHLGVNRRMLRSLSPESVSAELGVEPGGVAPIPLAPDHKLLIDEDVMTLPNIIVGSGLFTVTFEMAPDALVAATQADVLKVTR